MTKLLLLSCLLPLLLSAQKFKNPSVVSGRLVSVIPSLKNARALPGFIPLATRDESGLIVKKSYKEPYTDFGSAFAVDPVVQSELMSAPDAVGGNVGGVVVHRNISALAYTYVSPADPTMCAGPNHVIQMVNGRYGSYVSIWDKAGNSLVSEKYMYTFWTIPGYSGAGDPIVLYDQFADRYIVSEFGYSNGISSYINTLIFAVSMTNDPTGGWYVYKYADNTFFVDYPHYAIRPDAYYGTSNDFNTAANAYLGSSVYALEKAKMISGDSIARMQRFRLTSTQYGKFVSLAPVSVSGPAAPPADSTGLFMYFHDDNRTTTTSDVDSVGFIGMKPDFDSPSNTILNFQQVLTVAPFKSNVCGTARNCIPYGTGAGGYDAISDRFMNKIHYRNFGTHESIVACHTVDANYPSTPAKAGIRWYEFRRTGSGPWSVHQQGTYSPDADGRFIGSININSKGQIAVAYNISGVGKFASIRIAARNQNDPPGVLPYSEKEIEKGTAYGTFSNRWGDYNDLEVDPVGDTTFWLTAMYGSTPYWKSRVASVIVEPPFKADSTSNLILAPLTDTVLTTFILPSSYQYQWQLDTGTGFKNLSAGSIFGNVNTNQITITDLPTKFATAKLRCKITTVADSLFKETFVLKFAGTWTGAINTSWQEPGNWSGNFVPDQYMDITIPSGHTIEVSTDAYCRSLILGSGASLTMTNGSKLYVRGRPL